MFEKRDASVLLYTLIMLSVLVILSQQLFRGSIIGVTFNRTMISAEKAKMLALGGVNLAISQLTLENPKKKANLSGEKNKDENPLNDFLLRVLPNLNRWQEFDLKEDIDGMDGKLRICITCENGKININNAFDFKKGEFKYFFKKRFAGLEIPGKLKTGDILKGLTDFFKKRKRKIDEISELIEVSGLENIDVYYQPPKKIDPPKKSVPNRDIYIQDLFTTWTDEKDLMELLFLSDSCLAIFQFERPVADDTERLKNEFEQLAKSFSKDWNKNWEQNWTYMDPIFGKIPKDFTEIKKELSREFGPQVYSVLSYGEVGGVEQRLLVVMKKIEKNKSSKKIDKENVFSGSEELKRSKEFKIIRMYWL